MISSFMRIFMRIIMTIVISSFQGLGIMILIFNQVLTLSSWSFQGGIRASPSPRFRKDLVFGINPSQLAMLHEFTRCTIIIIITCFIASATVLSRSIVRTFASKSVSSRISSTLWLTFSLRNSTYSQASSHSSQSSLKREIAKLYNICHGHHYYHHQSTNVTTITINKIKILTITSISIASSISAILCIPISLSGLWTKCAIWENAKKIMKFCKTCSPGDPLVQGLSLSPSIIWVSWKHLIKAMMISISTSFYPVNCSFWGQAQFQNIILTPRIRYSYSVTEKPG